MSAHRFPGAEGVEPGIDMHWDDWLVIAGACSPVWGPLLARVFRWPWRLGFLIAAGPFGGLLFTGVLHDLLRRWSEMPARLAARFEVAATGLFLFVVCIVPVVRYYHLANRKMSGRRGA